MTLRQRQWLCTIFFALMFGHFGVNVYSTFVGAWQLEGSSDGWVARLNPDGKAEIVSADPKGPAAVLQPGDEFVSINGITLQDDAGIRSYNRRVPPGTLYTIAVRRQGQLLEFTLSTIAYPLRLWLLPIAEILIQLLFLLTGLTVFLLKPADFQAWLLALMLCTFTGLFNGDLPPLPTGLLIMVITTRVIGLVFLPVFFHFFLIFPDRSPWLKRIPRLERWLYIPFLFILPWFSFQRMFVLLRGHKGVEDFLRNSWVLKHQWVGLLAMSLAMGYLIGGLCALLIGYRAAGVAARRKLTLIVAGSGAGTLNLLALIIWETFFQARFPQAGGWLQIVLKFTLPLIPLTFAYAIIRHQVIPVSLILRRGVRYLLVSRGSILLHLASAVLVMFFVMETFFSYMPPMSGRAVGSISAVVGILLWNLNYLFHRRVLAPAIDRHFFRQSYDAQQIMTDLTQSLRSVTNLPQLLELVGTKIQTALQTENVTVFLRDRTGGNYQAVYSRDYQTPAEGKGKPEHHWQLSQQSDVIQQLAVTGEPFDMETGRDSQQSNDDSGIEWQALRELNAALLLPLTTKEEMIGLIALGPRLGDLPFSRSDKHLLMSVAGPTTFAIENARLVEKMIEEARRREEIEAENDQRAKELEEARQLQLSMLPKHLPQLPNLEIAAYMKTATEVGGDYYDFHLTADGTLTVAVGDATGHGLKAGTVVTAMKSLFHCFADEPELLPAMHRSSRVLKQMNLRSLFMGLTVIKLRGHALKISSAGMPPMLIYRSQDQIVEEVLIKAMPLGSITGYAYREKEFSLFPGDVVVLMSDGLPERFNFEDEMFDYNRVTQVLTQAANRPPLEIIERLAAAGEDWANGRPQDDDITFVVLKLKS